MKYIVAGGRDFNDYSTLNKVLTYIINPEDVIVSGCAKGADTLGAVWAAQNGIALQTFPAQWERYGKSAGFIRNAEMGDHADALIAFWDGKSKGTAHMIKTMKFKHKPYWVYNYEGKMIEKWS